MDKQNELQEHLDQALIRAAESGFFDSLKSAVDNGGNVNVEIDGKHPLLIAAYTGSDKGVAYLLEHGANPNQCVGGWTALHVAVGEGYLVCAKVLLENGADVNVRNANGFTALHCSAQSRFGNVESAKLLLQHGADTTLKIDDGRTAVDLANSVNNKEMASYITSMKEHEALETFIEANYDKRDVLDF